MLTLSKDKLKTHMLQVFRQIEQTGTELIVTNNNRPVLRIQPITTTKGVAEVSAPNHGQMIWHEAPDMPTADEWTEV